MKHAKKPTKKQSILIQEWGLNPADWMIERDTPSEMVLVHRHSEKNRKTITKGV